MSQLKNCELEEGYLQHPLPSLSHSMPFFSVTWWLRCLSRHPCSLLLSLGPSGSPPFPHFSICSNPQLDFAFHPSLQFPRYFSIPLIKTRLFCLPFPPATFLTICSLLWWPPKNPSALWRIKRKRRQVAKEEIVLGLAVLGRLPWKLGGWFLEFTFKGLLLINKSGFRTEYSDIYSLIWRNI